MRFRMSVFALVALAVTGCASGGKVPIRFYDGPTRPSAEIATLSSKGDPVFLLEIDGKPGSATGVMGKGGGYYGRGGSASFTIEMLPGAYKLLVQYQNYDLGVLTSGAELTRTFVAQAGHSYLLSARVQRQGSKVTWEPLITDVTSNVP